MHINYCNTKNLINIFCVKCTKITLLYIGEKNVILFVAEILFPKESKDERIYYKQK